MAVDQVPEKSLIAIEERFHELIRHRAGELIDRHGTELPLLRPTLRKAELNAKEGMPTRAWFPVRGIQLLARASRRDVDARQRELVPGGRRVGAAS